MVLSATLTLPASATFNQGSAAVQIAPTATLTDTNANLLNGNLIISEGLTADAGDTIAIKNVGTAAGQIGVSGSTVTYGGTNVGSFTGGVNGSPLVVSLNANATAAAAQALLQDVTFSTTDTASTMPRDITGIVTDGLGGFAIADEVIDVVGLGPVLTLANNTVNTVAGNAGSLLASGATLADNSVANLNGGKLTATITNNASVGDTLSLQSGNGVSVSGNTVSVNGTAIGTFSGGTSGAPLTVSFNSSATVADAQTLIQQLQLSTSANGSLAPRAISLQLSDGTNTQVGTANLTANVQAALGPVLSLPSSSVNFSLGGAAASVGAGATLTDASAANFAGGTLTVSETANANAADVLSIQNGGGITVTGNSVSFNGTAIGTVSGGTGGSPLMVALNSSADATAVQALVQNIGFSTSGNVSLATRALQIQLTDGTNASAATANVNVNLQAGVGPILSLPTSSVGFTLGGQASLLGSGATLTNTGAANFNGGKLTVSETANANANDVISLQSGNGVTVSGNTISFNGTVIGTLSGGMNGAPLQVSFTSTSATTAAVQAVVQDISFSTAGANPSLATRTVQLQLSDGTDASVASANVSVNVTGVLGPVLTLPSGSVNVTAGGSATVLGTGATLTDTSAVNFNNGMLTVSLPVGASTSDKLSIQTGGGVTVNGNTVSVNGTAIGTVSGGTNGQPLTVALNSSASAQGVQALLQNISLQAGASEMTGPLALNVSLTDGSGAAAATGTLTANVQAPIGAILNVAGTVNVRNSAAVKIDAGASITGINAANLNGATLNVQLLGGTNKSSLGIQSLGTGVRLSGSKIMVNGHVVGTFSGTKHNVTITFNANATVANVTQVLDALSFREIGRHKGGSEIVQMQFTDSAGVQSNMSSTTLTFNRGR